MDWAFPLRTRITKRALHVCGEKKKRKNRKGSKRSKEERK